MGILRAKGRKFALPTQSPWASGDRAPRKIFFWRRILLIFTALQILISSDSVKSQITNELVFERLVANFVLTQGYPIDSVKGFFTSTLLSRFESHVSSGVDLVIAEPRVEFSRIASRRFVRAISVVMNFADSTSKEFYVSFSDTVASEKILEIRKSKFAALRGENPRLNAKYLLPCMVIGTGIAVIISLFYLRS